jgi:hypothetical protein
MPWETLLQGVQTGINNFNAGQQRQLDKQKQDQDAADRLAAQKIQEALLKLQQDAAAREAANMAEGTPGTPAVPATTGILDSTSGMPAASRDLAANAFSPSTPGTPAIPGTPMGITRQKIMTDVDYQKALTDNLRKGQEPNYLATSDFLGVHGIPEGDPVQKRWLTNEERRKIAQERISQEYQHDLDLEKARQKDGGKNELPNILTPDGEVNDEALLNALINTGASFAGNPNIREVLKKVGPGTDEYAASLMDWADANFSKKYPGIRQYVGNFLQEHFHWKPITSPAPKPASTPSSGGGGLGNGMGAKDLQNVSEGMKQRSFLQTLPDKGLQITMMMPPIGNKSWLDALNAAGVLDKWNNYIKQ